MRTFSHVGYGAPLAPVAMNELTGAELRLELAEAEAIRPTTIVGQCRKANRVKAVTAALIEKGCF
jgi:hypothetical protein